MKASRKIYTLFRMSSFLSFDKKRIIFKAFFESQFKYFPLVWMFHGREVNQRINRLNERILRIVYNDMFYIRTITNKGLLLHYSSFKSAFFYPLSCIR